MLEADCGTECGRRRRDSAPVGGQRPLRRPRKPATIALIEQRRRWGRPATRRLGPDAGRGRRMVPCKRAQRPARFPLAGRGHKRALVAVAHSIVVILYHMLTRHEPYQDLGADYFEHRNPERLARRLVQQGAKLGYQVTLTPLPTAA